MHMSSDAGLALRVAEQVGRKLGEDVRPARLLEAMLGPQLSQSKTTLLTHEAMMLWRRFGQQVYCVGPHLSELLRRTTCSDLSFEDLRLPFGGFYVALRDCPIELWADATTFWRRATGIYVYEVEEVDGREVYMVLWGADDHRSRYKGDDATTWIRFHQTDDGTLEEYLRRVFDGREAWSANGVIEDTVLGEPLIPSDANRDAASKAVVDLARLVFNLLAYLQCDGAELDVESFDQRAKPLRDAIARKKSRKKAKKLQQQLDKLPTATVSYVGTKLEAELRNARGFSGRAPARAHWVSGHWKKVWSGPVETRTCKLRWIKPYQRNTDYAGAVERQVRKVTTED